MGARRHIMKTADPELMRAINRYHVIDVIRRYGPISRVEITERTELSPATVSAITGGLIEDGIVNIRHVSVEGLARGRPRVMLELNGEAYHVAGVKLSLHRISIAVTDFKGSVLHSLIIPVRISRQSPEVIADLVEDGVRQCVSDSGLDMSGISGIGVGIPGIIDGTRGISYWSPVLGPDEVPFGRYISERIGKPALIENDANLVAVAENWFGHARDRSTFAVVTVENSIGMGLFIDGKLYRGAHGIGAEFGHVKIEPDGPRCQCGQSGCLDAYASDSGIVALARADGLIRTDDDRPVHQIITDLARRAASDDGLAALFRRAGQMLGLGLANVVNVLNPPLIIVSGEGLRAGGLITDALLASLDRHVLPTLREATEVIFHPWGDEMWARGAASLVLCQIYEVPWDSHAT